MKLKRKLLSKKQAKKPNLKDSPLKYRQDLSYAFPIDLLLNKRIQDRQQFKRLMKVEAKNTGFDKNWKMNTSKSDKGDTIYVRCSECSCVLKYFVQNGVWNLIQYKNSHIHTINKSKTYNQLVKMAIIQNIGAKNEEITEKLQQSYPAIQLADITRKKREIFKQPNQELLRSILLNLGYQFKSQSDLETSNEQYPECLVAVSQHQKENYKKYGEILSYDITYNLAMDISQKGKKYGVGIFSGFDNNNRVLIFGFSLTTTQTSEDFKKIFNWFFDLNGFTRTTAIITDQQISLVTALEALKNEKKYTYYHVFDSWHFLRACRQSMKGISKSTQDKIIEKLFSAMKQLDPNLGPAILRQVQTLMFNNDLLTEYQRLQKNLDKVCFWKLPKQFFGMNLHSNECINDLLKRKIEYQTSLIKLIERFDKMSQERNWNCANKVKFQKFPAEDLFENEQVKELRFLFENKVYRFFLNNYRKSLFYKCSYTQNQYTTVTQIFTRDQYVINIKNFQCSCGAFQKTGIPCEHILYMCRIRTPQQKYSGLFNERWVPDSVKIQKISNRGRKRRTRRNHIG